MKSIRTKILLLVICGVLVSASVVAAICLINLEYTLRQDSSEIMRLLCAEKKQEIDRQLTSIEQSVNTIRHFAAGQLDDVERLWTDEEYRNSYLDKVAEVSVNVAESTETVISVYYRLNAEKAGPKAGVYLVKDTDGSYESFPVTDLSAFDKSDTDAVGWYYKPSASGKEEWIAPYIDHVLGILMISYSIPIYVDNQMIGVIGMDVETDTLYRGVDSVQIYDTGYAFLMDEKGNIIYHRDYPQGIARDENSGELAKLHQKLSEVQEEGQIIEYVREGKEKQLVFQKLGNDMLFSICVPKKEILEPKQQVMRYVCALIFATLCVVIIVAVRLSEVMIRPLKQLTKAAQKIANSDLNVSIECNTKDEVGVLARSFQLTTEHLKNYIGTINKLAYTDALTGIGNKTAYEAIVQQLEKQMEQGNAEFSLVVMDINDLKKMNDTFGHEKGDELIQNTAAVLKKVWKEENVYRIGGDEFVAVETGKDSHVYEKRMEALEAELVFFNRRNPHFELPLQVAQGAAVYEPDGDERFADVFRRADARMYQDKEKKKGKK